MKKSSWYAPHILLLVVGVALLGAASRADVLFQDGFESGGIAAGGWLASGDASLSGNAFSGSYAAMIDDAGSFHTVVSTAGFESIDLAYARYTYGYDSGEELTVQWSTDGSSWSDVETFTGGWALHQAALPAGAADQGSLHIRFVSDANGYYERFRIDDVAVHGTPIGQQPPDPTPDPDPDPQPDPEPDPSPAGCLPAVTSYTAAGPFDSTYRSVSNVKMYVPDGLPAGCRVPIIHFANGTGASCSNYADTLRHYASHGFIAACYEDTDTGQGTQALSAIQTVIAEHPGLVDTKYGFTGHSQGGGGAIMGLYRAEQQWGSSRLYTAFAVEPAHGYGDSPSNWESYYAQIYSSVSMFNGSSDRLVSASWVRDGYDALDAYVEKAWYEAVGASHMTPIPNDEASEFGLAWFRWQLLGDSAACQYFKDMPNASGWRLQDADNLSSCN